jgi:cysteine desulfurase / selenocysteine lyase
MGPGQQADPFASAREREFPGLQDIHLNSASYAPVPARAYAAMGAFEERRSRAALHPDDFGPVLARARSAAARLVGGTADEIALVPNTSTGLNLAAMIVRQRAARAGSAARRTIVLPDGEFPANVYCWLALQRDGFHVARVATDAAGCPREDALIARLQQDDVAALAISAVQFATGYQADLVRLGEACREAGVLFVVDGIQAVGVTPVDVAAAHVDVLASGGHKWLCGPFGTGFVYVRKDLCLEHEPDLPGWLAFESSMDFETLLSYQWDLFPDARRFELGSLPVQGFVGLTESMELLLQLNVVAIRNHVRRLQQPLLEWARTAPGVRAVVTDDAHTAGILAVRVPDAGALHAALADAGISTVPREGALRFAPHFFNTAAEMDRVVAHLRRWTQ